MKRMQDKESMTWLSWAIVAGIACWGGLVRYLIDIKQSKAAWSWINAIAQVVVSWVHRRSRRTNKRRVKP